MIENILTEERLVSAA